MAISFSAPRWKLSQRGDLQLSERRHGNSSRDRRGCHHEQMSAFSQPIALIDAEAMLLINDDEPEKVIRTCSSKRARPR